MIISVITLFPEIFQIPLNTSVIKKAREKKLVSFHIVNLRDYGIGAYKSVDDHPYGGGVGMILRVDTIAPALEDEKKRYGFPGKKTHSMLMDPRGKLFDQKMARNLSQSYDHLILIAGHYEGVDERVASLVDETVSIGDYILTGGEIPSLVVIDSITRLIPNVLKPEATKDETFEENGGQRLLGYPQYTRPEIFQGKKVPAILLSGNHHKIQTWRRNQSLSQTQKLRPDIIVD